MSHIVQASPISVNEHYSIRIDPALNELYTVCHCIDARVSVATNISPGPLRWFVVGEKIEHSCVCACVCV